jgi:putative transposase
MLPPCDHDYTTRWMLIKTNFSRRMVRGERVRRSRMSKGERGIWQRRYWEHLICDDPDFARHVDYIHYNPVKHGYAGAAAHWPYSSIHRYIARGSIPVDWGGTFDDQGDFGER